MTFPGGNGIVKETYGEEVQKWKSRGAALRKGVEESLPVFREKQERDERVYRPDTEESP